MRHLLMLALLLSTSVYADGIITIPSPTPPCGKTDIGCLESQENSGITKQMNASFNQAKSNFENSMKRVWRNPYLTPQQIMDSYGTNACHLFTDASATITWLTAIVPAYAPPTPPQTFVINSNCTVTTPSPTPSASPSP